MSEIDDMIFKIVVVFDMDGTLSDCEHRRHFVEGKKKDFDAFFDAAPDDPPTPIVYLAQWLGHVYDLVVVTARPERCLKDTKIWLESHEVPYIDLYSVRPDGNYEPDSELKRQWLYSYPRKEDIAFVFDDRDAVVAMWRGEGLTCLQVADGNF